MISRYDSDLSGARSSIGQLAIVERFLDRFEFHEMDTDIARRTMALRRECPRLKVTDRVILANAQAGGRILVTRNIMDSPAATPGIRGPYFL